MAQHSLSNELPVERTASHHVVIIGGGIAGLSAAYYLQKTARAAGVPLRYTLVERDTRLGGKLMTDSDGEFVVEAGPDSFITQKPWGLRLARELGLEDQLIGTNERRHKVYVLVNGHPRPMPDGMLLADSDFILKKPEEQVVEMTVRCRTIGDMTCTGVWESSAATLQDIIDEIAAARQTERGGRADDKRSETAMEDRKKQGYF